MDLKIDVTPDLDQFASRWKAAESIIREEMLVAMRKSVLIVENQGKGNLAALDSRSGVIPCARHGRYGGSLRGIRA
jgi:hypothetical protein